MSFHWILIYNAFIIPILFLLINFLRFFNSKLEHGFHGRMKTWEELKDYVKKHPGHVRILIHSASLGEFEQAKPIIRGIKRIRPEWRIIASFSSPSGYNHAQRMKEVDLWIYLPFDTWHRMRKFLQLLRPAKIIFTSYDLWPNLIYHANRYHIPLYLASARVRENSAKFMPVIRGFFKDLYRAIDHIYAVSEKDQALLNQLVGSARVKVVTTGDTRYDQVMERASVLKNNKVRRLFPSGKVFIAGSVWPADQSVLLPALKTLLNRFPDLRCIIAPHEPTSFAIESMMEDFKRIEFQSIPYSALRQQETRIVIIDRVGFLAELYHQSDIAFVGGSFRSEIHNVMEPAVAGIPVLFGPYYHNSREAEFLLEAGGALLVHNSQDMVNVISRLLTDQEYYQQVAHSAWKFIQQNIGASTRVIQHIIAHEPD